MSTYLDCSRCGKEYKYDELNEHECADVIALRSRVALLEKAAEEYRFALIFYAAQANYIVAGEGMNWVIADQGARARAALDAVKEE